MFGTMFSDELISIMICYQGLVFIYFGGGAFTNYNGKMNDLQSFFLQISPFRYATEHMMSIMLNKVDEKEFVLDFFEL